MIRGAIAGSILAVACGCATSSSYDANSSGDPPIPFLRHVEADIRPDLTGQEVDCVAVLPWREGGDLPIAELVDASMMRHVRLRFPRIVAQDRVASTLETHGFSTGSAEERERLGRLLGCPLLLQAGLHRAEADYLLLWTRYRLGMEISLRRAGDDVVLWRARHVAERLDGTLPLSIASIAVSVLSAGRSANDNDVVHSLVDDLTRRIFETLRLP